VFASDLHGDNQNPKVVGKLYDFLDKFNPDIRLFGGDLFDFRAMRKGGSAMERSESMAGDVQAGMEFLERFRPSVFLRGNHDERIWDFAQHAELGIIRDAAKEGVRDIKDKCNRIKCKMLPYDAREGVYRLHGLTFIHGFHAGLYATKKHAEVYATEGGCVLHGHTHGIQRASITRLGGGEGRGVGCLARLDMDYNRHQTGKLIHANGWAYGVVWNGGHEIFQAQESKDGRWVVATELEAI